MININISDQTLKIYQQINSVVEKQENRKDVLVDSSLSLSEAPMILSENKDPALCMKQSLELSQNEW